MPSHRLLPRLAALTVAAAFSAPAAAQAEDVVVGFDAEVTAQQRQEALRSVGGTRSETVADSGAVVVQAAEVPAGRRERLARSEHVRWVVPNEELRLASSVCDRERAGTPASGVFSDSLACLQWYFAAGEATGGIDAADRWSEILAAPGTTLAVLDTGVDFGHSDLQGRAWRNPADGTRGFDVTRNTPWPRDVNGHGTAVAGLAAASSDGGGIAGTCPTCRVMDVKVVPDGVATAPLANVLAGIDFAAGNGARVINLSVNADSTRELRALFVDLMRAYPAVTFVVAAGNEGVSSEVRPQTPCDAAAEAPNGLCVAASTRDDRLASFSNFGADVQIAAPGDSLYVPSLGGGWKYDYGTSFAAPLVSGMVGVLRSLGASARQSVQAVLSGAAQPIDMTDTPTARRLDVSRALDAFAAMPSGDSDVPHPTPTPTPTVVPERTPAGPVEEDGGPPAQPTPTPSPTPRLDPANNPRLAKVTRVRHVRGAMRTTVSCSNACTLSVRVYNGRTQLLKGTLALKRSGSKTFSAKISATRYRRIKQVRVRVEGAGHQPVSLTRRPTKLR